MKARAAASVLLVGALALPLAGCGFLTPQATTFHYDASDGVSTTVGDLDIENALVLTEDGEDGNLLFAVVNESDSPVTLAVQYEAADGRETVQVPVAPGASQVGFGDKGQLALRGIGTPAGSLLAVYFQYGSEQGSELLVPVLDGTLPQYADHLPTPEPTPILTPAPTSTSAPTDDATVVE